MPKGSLAQGCMHNMDKYLFQRFTAFSQKSEQLMLIVHACYHQQCKKLKNVSFISLGKGVLKLEDKTIQKLILSCFV